MPRLGLHVENWGFHWTGDWLFRNLTFALPEKGVVSVTGPNGSGKTTLLRLIASGLAPTEGQAWWDGEPLERMPRLKLGWAPGGESYFYSHLTGRENLEIFASMQGVPNEVLRKRCDDWMSCPAFRLALPTRFDECSLGMKQILHLVRAVVHEPVLLVVDEPIRSLDATSESFVVAFLQRWVKDRMLIFASHGLERFPDFQSVASAHFHIELGENVSDS